jgi:hypothetical protein
MSYNKGMLYPHLFNFALKYAPESATESERTGNE